MIYFYYNKKFELNNEKIQIINEKMKMINELNELIKEKTFNINNYLKDNYDNIELKIYHQNDLFSDFKHKNSD